MMSVDELESAVGEEFGPSDWLLVDQNRINQFAEATIDHQFIHVDPKAAAATPFGTTIAHGFLTLSLVVHLTAGLTPLPKGLTTVINYGLNKVRFLQPVKVDSEIRARVNILDVRRKGKTRILMTSEVTIEIKGEKRPALLAETLILFLMAGK
jgi:acyl dehydratase